MYIIHFQEEKVENSLMLTTTSEEGFSLFHSEIQKKDDLQEKGLDIRNLKQQLSERNMHRVRSIGNMENADCDYKVVIKYLRGHGKL